MEPRDPPDLARFLERLHSPAAGGFFAQGREVVVGRAPGRLDVMGGIADYSGSLVLQLPTREATFAAVQRDPERRLRIVSQRGGAAGGDSFEMPLAAFESGRQPVDYEAARALFARDAATAWAAYVAGVFLVLARERQAAFADGARILIASDVPEGKGVSSSAALEVAVMFAVARAYGIELAPRDMALLSQKVENLVVGAPCGVMDQMTACCGEEDRLLALLCQPAELQEPVALPEDVAVYGIDSGIRHAVAGADYGSVRIATFMGHAILSRAAGSASWRDYLANLTPEELTGRFLHHLPQRMRGADFLARYGETRDTVTRVDPDRDYAVRVCAAHPVHEHSRVQRFAALLREPAGEERRQGLGELMYASHASYSACGLGSSGTDRLVQLVREERRHARAPLYGAKITGGGCGGTVAVLAGSGPAGNAAVAHVAERYASETGHTPKLFAGSSPGAARFGTRVVQAMLLVGLAQGAGGADKAWKFDFGPGKAASGYTQVLADTAYGDERGYGFDFGSRVECLERGGKDPLRDGICTSDKPFFFSVKVPEGNYRVTVTLGDPAGATVNTVKAESRRLMLTKVETHAGDFDTRRFCVNVRNAGLPGGGQVRLNAREAGALRWDDKLTLEFSNMRPALSTLEIEPAPDAVTVFLAGDSTVTDQLAEPYAAWGQMITRFFKPTVAVANHAESGETLKAFTAEGRLDKLLGQMKAGDYLFIQFTHNDQKPGPNHLDAATTYKDELRRFMAEARKKKAYPVLVTSMQRRRFDTAGKIVNSLEDYPEAMREVAQQDGVPLIDLAETSRVFYEALGPEKSKLAFVHYPANSFPGQTEELMDDTHFSTYGAYELARAVVEAIKKKEPRLARHLLDRIPPWDPARPDRLETWSLPPDPPLPGAPPSGR